MAFKIGLDIVLRTAASIGRRMILKSAYSLIKKVGRQCLEVWLYLIGHLQLFWLIWQSAKLKVG